MLTICYRRFATDLTFFFWIKYHISNGLSILRVVTSVNIIRNVVSGLSSWRDIGAGMNRGIGFAYCLCLVQMDSSLPFRNVLYFQNG